MTFFAGQELFADDFPDLVNPARMGFRVARAAAQSLTSGAVASISWDTERQDTDGFITVPSTTATIPTGCAGIYIVTARQILSALPTANRSFMELNVTSSLTDLTTDYRVAALNTNESGRFVVTAVIPFADGDSFVVNSLQSSGGALNVTALLSCYRICE